jgi:hypothetical protein
LEPHICHEFYNFSHARGISNKTDENKALESDFRERKPDGRDRKIHTANS